MLRAGHDRDVWPPVVLLVAVLIPAVCLLGFMAAAMRNEQLAVKEKLAEIYRGRLLSSRASLDRAWSELNRQLETAARSAPASAAFARCLEGGNVDAVIILDAQGGILYPNTPSVFPAPSSDLDAAWSEGSRLEFLRKDFIAAARFFDRLARESTHPSSAARAWQAAARCLVQAGQKEPALTIVDEILGREQFAGVGDAQGRLIVANAELMVLELIEDRTSPSRQAIAHRLQRRLMDYDQPVLAASQRRFLMKEVRRLSPEIEFSTLSAEELAAEAAESIRRPDAPLVLGRGSIPGVWQFATSNHQVLALVRPGKLASTLRGAVAADDWPVEAEVALLPPEVDAAGALVTLPAGSQMPGWRLALSLKDERSFELTAKQHVAVYLLTGILVVAAMAVMALLAARVLRRQTALAQLKNDLAATVSHELKTPLSSMRVLVDTLLRSEKLDRTVREYLELIAQENERLSRLIQNFLTFSRIERKQFNFQFVPLAPKQIVNAAVEAVRDRFNAAGCQLEVEIDSGLPEVRADADAIVTAMINLLDNACKFSQGGRRVIVSGHRENGNVALAVKDHGIGIAPADRKRIFRRFYQADRRLARTGGGCGLGLSIVEFIVTAHCGTVSVTSQPGQGSTFTLSLPVPPPAGARHH